MDCKRVLLNDDIAYKVPSGICLVPNDTKNNTRSHVFFPSSSYDIRNPGSAGPILYRQAICVAFFSKRRNQKFVSRT